MNSLRLSVLALTMWALGSTVVAQDADMYNDVQDAPPVLRDITWRVGDTTVEAILEFDYVPSRYSTYALEEPHRIVMDCYGVGTELSLVGDSTPPPVTKAELAPVSETGVELLRLVLFTPRAIEYTVSETPSRLRLVMQWNSRMERQTVEEARRRKRRIIGWTSGAAVAATTAAVVIGVLASDDPVGPEEIPLPGMSPPND